eukprot:2230320-Amphidinium_carterae.1
MDQILVRDIPCDWTPEARALEHGLSLGPRAVDSEQLCLRLPQPPDAEMTEQYINRLEDYLDAVHNNPCKFAVEAS